MQRTYKHTLTPIGELQVGQPVWIPDPPSLGLPPGPPVFGTVNKCTASYPRTTNFVLTLNTAATVINTKGAPSADGSGYYNGLPPTTLIAVLTGSKAASVVSEYWRSIIAGGPFPHHNIETSGCDPEIFVSRGDGSTLPAFEFLPSKAHKSESDSPAYWDGWQAEFAPLGGHCHEFLTDRIHNGLKTVLQSAQKLDPKATLSLRSVIQVGMKELAAAAPEHVAFGCLPSLNAYGDSGSPIGDPTTFEWRMAGGHIHLGRPFLPTATQNKGPSPLHTNPEEIVKTLDATAGIATVGMFGSLDDPFRRKFYGLAGEYRLPAHGLEYRVLSNAWLCHPTITHLTLDLVRGMCGLVGGRKSLGLDDATEVRRIINQCDVSAARAWVLKHEGIYRAFFTSRYGATHNAADHALRVIYEGVESLVGKVTPESMMDGWKLNLGQQWTTQSGGGVQFRYILPTLPPFVARATATAV